MSAVGKRTGGEATLLILALENANQTLTTSNSATKEIRVAPFHLVTIDWDTLVIRKVGPDPLNKFLQNSRNSQIPPKRDTPNSATQ